MRNILIVFVVIGILFGCATKTNSFNLTAGPGRVRAIDLGPISNTQSVKVSVQFIEFNPGDDWDPSAFIGFYAGNNRDNSVQLYIVRKKKIDNYFSAGYRVFENGKSVVVKRIKLVKLGKKVKVIMRITNGLVTIMVKGEEPVQIQTRLDKVKAYASVSSGSAKIKAVTREIHSDLELFDDLKRLAENDHPEAQYYLGMLYNNGVGTQKDTNKAFKWFEKSASSGDPLGSYKVGCYYAGQGKGVVEIDDKEALKYKLAAAQEGYALAQFDVASLYYKKGEVDKAAMWWKESANQGFPVSVYALFSLYYKGKHIPKDLTLAYGYLKVIEKNIGERNSSKIQEKVKELESQLSKEQLVQGMNIVKSWSPKRTALTIKALSGLKESRRLVERNKQEE